MMSPSRLNELARDMVKMLGALSPLDGLTVLAWAMARVAVGCDIDRDLFARLALAAYDSRKPREPQ